MKRSVGEILFVFGVVILINCFVYLAIFVWPLYENSTPDIYFKTAPVTNRVSGIGAIGLLLATVGVVLTMVQVALRSLRSRANKQRKDF